MLATKINKPQHSTFSFRSLLALIALCCALALPQISLAYISKADIQQITRQAPNLSAKVLNLAITAHDNVIKRGIKANDIITVVDYSLPSVKDRLFVINLKTKKLIEQTVVSHGSGSGNNFATRFSNTVNSHASSLGVYLTSNSYVGKHGYSLRLKGLEKGINDNAFKRAIVMHSAWYAEKNIVKKLQRLGRSFGCFAIPTSLNHKIIDTIKDGSLIFAYYPDNNWLKHSRFLS